jgi:hypothetical protein
MIAQDRFMIGEVTLVEVRKARQSLVQRTLEALRSAVELELFNQNIADSINVLDAVASALDGEVEYVTKSLLDSVSRHLAQVYSGVSSVPAPRSASDIYSVRSNSASKENIFAMRDCYVDYINEAKYVEPDELLFSLNGFEIDRETYKLKQELLLSQITDRRLTEDYVRDFVFRPMEATIDVAQSDLEAAEVEVEYERRQLEIGEGLPGDLTRAEIALEEKRIIVDQAESDLIQRQIEIDGQRRRLAAEQEDYNQRLRLNGKIKEMHEFRVSRKCRVTWHTWQGAFVEEGDPMCTLDYLV